jgi:hypothetical protein
MAEFTSYDPENVEALGEVIESFVLAFPEQIRPHGVEALERQGIREIKPDQYYPAQAFLNAMKEIAEKAGRNMMTRVGERIALRVDMPEGFDTLKTALEGLDTAYHSKYIGGEIGHWKYTHEGNSQSLTRGVMVSTNHYCCAFDRGVLEGFAKRFRPGNVTDALVRHDDSSPCRKNGGDSCTYIITWG